MVGVTDKQVEEDVLDTEINNSRNVGLLRGVKRRCLDAGWEGGAIDTGIGARERSFLETKWESEVRRRREYFGFFFHQMMILFGSGVDLKCR